MDKQTISESAWATRLRVLADRASNLVPCAEIISAATSALGLNIARLPHGDPLLCGALAMLDSEASTIWLDGGLGDAECDFSAAHELAHAIWHQSCEGGMFNSLDDFDTRDELDAQTAEGYSPQQHREYEANYWAVEFLIPGAVLRSVFLKDHMAAPVIAETVCLPLSLVRSHMRDTLLRLPFNKADIAHAVAAGGFDNALDASQLEAATVKTGPYLLAAGPGTGKTRTLVARCVHLVRDKGTDPESILALTFSRKAAIEMRERLISAGIGNERSGPWVGTFHAFCMETLQRYGQHIGLRSGWRLVGDGEAFALLERNLVLLKLRELMKIATPTLHLKDILKAISRAKDELCEPERFKSLADSHIFDCNGGPDSDEANRLREVADVYPVYEQILAKAGRLDYGDLIMKTVQLLERNPGVCLQLNRQYPQIVADEYQDVNYACARLLKLLAGPSAEGLWAVGDRRQSIYRFRGASPANVALFDREYPNGKRGALAVNYRSLPQIVNIFAAAAERMSAADSDIFQGWSCKRADTRKEGPRVKLAVADTVESQAIGIAQEMRRLNSAGLMYGDQVVLCRAHSQAMSIADALLLEGIPVLYVGDLFDRIEVKDLVCLLDIFTRRGATSVGSLLRVARLVGVSLPPETLKTIAAAFSQAESSSTTAQRLLHLAQQKTVEIPQPILDLCQRLSHLSTAPSILESYLFDDPSPLSPVLNRMDNDRTNVAITLATLRKLLEFATDRQKTYERDVVSPDEADGEADSGPDAIAWFLSDIRRLAVSGERITVSSADSDDGFDAVRIMTIHAAKGLEFPAVFLPNLSKGKFPTQDRSPYIVEPRGLCEDRLMGVADLDEESCLFFVALSRARDYLFLSRAMRYSQNAREVEPSPFLQLISLGLERIGVAPDHWSFGTESESATREKRDLLTPLKTKPRFSSSALELYRRCPRQYYYRQELGLSGGDDSGEYLRYSNAVRSVTDWMQDQWRERTLPTTDEIQAKLGEIWALQDGLPGLYDQLYLQQAMEVLSQTREVYSARFETEQPVTNRTLAAELSNCCVHVGADLLTLGAGGEVRAVRQRNAKAKNDDHTHPKLSLLRSGLQQSFGDRSTKVELQYSSTGKVVNVPPSARWEPGRLRKYEEAADGILRREFDPRPENTQYCTTCAFRFICPE